MIVFNKYGYIYNNFIKLSLININRIELVYKILHDILYYYFYICDIKNKYIYVN